MRKQQSENVEVPGREDLIDIVDPSSGTIIPTVRWVAEELLMQGWTLASDQQVFKTENKES